MNNVDTNVSQNGSVTEPVKTEKPYSTTDEFFELSDELCQELHSLTDAVEAFCAKYELPALIEIQVANEAERIATSGFVHAPQNQKRIAGLTRHKLAICQRIDAMHGE